MFTERRVSRLMGLSMHFNGQNDGGKCVYVTDDFIFC